MTKFEIGKNYFAESSHDTDCVFHLTVIGRSAKTIVCTHKVGGEPKTVRLKIHTDSNHEFVNVGSYAGHPVFRSFNEASNAETETVENFSLEAETAEKTVEAVPVVESHSIASLKNETEMILAVGERKISGTCNSAKWLELRTPEQLGQLREIENSSKGSRHVPFQHWSGIEQFCNVVSDSGLTITAQLGMLSPNTEKFMFVCDISAHTEFEDFTFQLGFLSYNDESKSLRIIAGEKVFVCSNQMIRCCIEEKRKHLKNIVSGFSELLTTGIEKFKTFRENRVRQFDAYRKIEVNDKMLGNLLLDFHRSPVFGKNPLLIGRFFNEWENQHGSNPRHAEFSEQNLWSMQNCVTEQLKTISPSKRLGTDAELNRILSYRAGLIPA